MNEDNLIDLDKFEGSFFDDFTDGAKEIASSSSKNKKTPVIILSGFLGSGKTTLLNYLLKDSPELKIGVIVNDFGKINIDSKLTAGNVSEKTIELSNGCICCILGDNGLKEPLDILANETSQPDFILIEASGVAEPYDLMQTLRFSGNDFTQFGGNIYTIDVKNFEQTHKKHKQHFEKCIKTADIILLNKIDLITEVELDNISRIVKEINPKVPIIQTVKSQIDKRLIFDLDTAHEDRLLLLDSHLHPHDHNHHEHIHEQYESLSFSTKKPLSPEKFVQFLDNLPENLFRAKGFCYFGMKGYEQKFTLQIVGKYIEFFAQEWKNESPETNLVLIGSNLNKAEIFDQLNNLIDKNPENITPNSMLNFERFLVNSSR